MEVKLRVIGGKNAGQELPVTGPRFVIGRQEGCHLRAKSEAVAMRHCELELGSGSMRVNDLGSPAGTIVNGERIAGSRELKFGDRLKIGPLEFELCASAKLAAKKKPKVNSIGEAAARLAGGRQRDLDLDDLLGPKDESEEERSLYAAELTDEEKAALGLIKNDATPAAPAPSADPNQKPGQVDTRQLASDVLHKYLKGK